MPKKRRRPGTRKVEKRLLIFCEGAKDKSESAYFKALLKDCIFPGNKIEIKVVDTKKNTGKELVKEAKNEREFIKDIIWVVYDKDGYSKHAETFDFAKSNKIKIAFSSISFEYWILLHYEYTSKPFLKSEEIISYLKNKYQINYSKSDPFLYEKTKINIEKAIERAVQIQKHQLDSSYNQMVFNFNPYTDIDKLIEDIKNMVVSFGKQKQVLIG